MMGCIRAVLASLVLGLPLFADVFAQQGPAATASAESAAKAITAAETARQKAAALGAEWLQTQSLIEQAQRAEAQGHWAEAVERAEQAREQGELASEQAEREAKAWRDRVVR